MKFCRKIALLIIIYHSSICILCLVIDKQTTNHMIGEFVGGLFGEERLVQMGVV